MVIAEETTAIVSRLTLRLVEQGYRIICGGRHIRYVL